jgi:hypothetical protein
MGRKCTGLEYTIDSVVIFDYLIKEEQRSCICTCATAVEDRGTEEEGNAKFSGFSYTIRYSYLCS